MEIDTQKLAQIRKFALDSAKQILSELGIDPNSKEYPHQLYEIQYGIYHAVKKALNLKSE